MSIPTKAMLLDHIRRLEGDLADSKTMQVAWRVRAQQLADVLKQMDTLMRQLQYTEIEYGLSVAISETLINSDELLRAMSPWSKEDIEPR